MVTSSTIYELKKKVTIQTDASKDGLGYVISQEGNSNIKQKRGGIRTDLEGVVGNCVSIREPTFERNEGYTY